MSAKIPPKDMQRAAKEFTLPMIEIIKPKIVIALGKETFCALYNVCGHKTECKKNPFKLGDTKVFWQYHPAARISNEKKSENWKQMKDYLNGKM